MGTAADDSLTDRSYTNGGMHHFQGLDGDDKISDTGGDDILEGGLGADQFIFDNRNSGDEITSDLVTDLNFAEGDTLRILTSIDGLFTDDVDQSNTMHVSTSAPASRWTPWPIWWNCKRAPPSIWSPTAMTAG